MQHPTKEEWGDFADGIGDVLEDGSVEDAAAQMVAFVEGYAHLSPRELLRAAKFFRDAADEIERIGKRRMI